MGHNGYPISMVIPTLRGWPGMRVSLDAVLPQVRALGGQLIVADGSGRPAPEHATGSDVVWLSMPEATVFELRQAAYRRTEGEIVAVTEDHCQPNDDWLALVARAHAEDPGAAIIFGSVENASTEHLIDWAVYCSGYGRWAPPLSRDATGNPGHANLSWKRRAFGYMSAADDRVLEFRFVAAARRAGERVVGDQRLSVRHHQCDPIGPTAELFFNNGRAIASRRRAHMGSSDWVRLLAPGVVAGYRTLRILGAVLSKPWLRGPAVRSLVLIGLLNAVHALGEAVGYVSGPGDSGRRVH